jgi:hypothetical protein
MPNEDDLGLSELHETIRAGERVLIRRVRQAKESVADIISQRTWAFYQRQ